MLRITVHDQPGTLTFRLEGRLGGEWVQVFEECWQSAVTGRCQDVLYVDLSEVTSVDAAGRACLMSLYRKGTRFITADCLTQGIAAEINQGTESD